MEDLVFSPTEDLPHAGIIVVEEIIREYPSLRAAVHEIRQTSSTPLYGLKGTGKGGRKDPTASAAMRELPNQSQIKYEAVRQTIRRTNYRKDGHTRLLLIDLLYWKRTHTLAEAAVELSCTERVAQRYQDEFIHMVKEALGITDCEGCLHYRPILPRIMACHYCWDVGHLRIQDMDQCYSKVDSCDPPYYEEEVM